MTTVTTTETIEAYCGYNPLLCYKQTQGGDYSSRPQTQDVFALLDGDRDWEEAYADRGHGEYIDNIHAFVDAARQFGLDDKAVAVYLAVIEPIER